MPHKLNVPEVQDDNSNKENIDVQNHNIDIKKDSQSPTEESIWADKQTIYCHSDWPKEDGTCYICFKKSADLIKCEMNIGTAKCPVMFHEKCAKEYNAAGFSYEFLSKAFRKKCCSMHHCSFCFSEKRKTSSICFDIEGQELVTCDSCLHSVHMCCLPATPTVIKKELIAGNSRSETNSYTCPSHLVIDKKYKNRYPKFTQTKIQTKNHFPFCLDSCDLEEAKPLLDDQLVYCKACVRSYHPRCHRFAEYIKNGKKHYARDLCESCILHDYVRHKGKAIALWSSKFYPCEMVSWSDFPERYIKQDKFGYGFGKPGYVAVQWGGCDALFAILPVTMTMQMIGGSYMAYGEKMSNKKYNIAWEAFEQNNVNYRAVAHAPKYTPITTSVYTKGCKRIYKTAKKDDFKCECKDNDPSRCGSCINLISGYDCPPSCEIDKDGHKRECLNRRVSKGELADGIEKRLTQFKGEGIFATKIIPKGTLIGEYAGELINAEEKNRRIKKSVDEENQDDHHYMMDIIDTSKGKTNSDDCITVDCKYKGNLMRFVNHSCEPNCTVNTHRVVVSESGGICKYVERVAVIAIRDIKVDEELCFNYSMESYEGAIIPPCFCGTKSCSGRLGKPKKSKTCQTTKRRNDQKTETSKKRKFAEKNVATKKSSMNKMSKLALTKIDVQCKENLKQVDQNDSQGDLNSIN